MEYPILIPFILFCFAKTCHGDGAGVLFSTLPKTLLVAASPQQGQVLQAGEDRITVKWSLNESFQATGVDKLYKKVKVTLCYAPISQIDRGWRRTVDNLRKDKTCQFTIDNRAYDASSQSNQSLDWTIGENVPTATYFVRVYAYNSADEEVGFGQTTDAKKTSNLFVIKGVSGRHNSLEVVSICFSAFSVVAFFGFFLVEKRKNRSLSKN
ncbi:high-affinity nitrate transporter 3.2 [Ziziphus jujuba]|uniref:High-affinity nitrate transporter n=2 Tax=Ziziphus jujuba TaxID=326968 RepID=A0A978ULK9_ZIZJJ|nr:high-affinity nitrate transporter 3.2 [Ziziphus jujuba]XP_048318719.1 high-affinity nitrate transporter 3.2-like [Ziziphus jujuba var. spinosa]KAH7515711.1 hypothetical protein FEM48_Zijuj10G0055400 [Ziziphus jujuba var. spinosa]KAH7515720.1 hypothetical protein FEM48_Zijuj10G0056400 [Ziziphus jujuba var. spinosa]